MECVLDRRPPMVRMLVAGSFSRPTVAGDDAGPLAGVRMKALLKIPRSLISQIHDDLHRPHAFAHERVGFLTAGATEFSSGGILMIVREYSRVDDEDYEFDPSCGARIGGNAFRKALQRAYRARSALFHVHSHGGIGIPAFSEIDLQSGSEFVPGFFEAIPSMPHGMIVLSSDRAAALLWLNKRATATPISSFAFVGAPMVKFEVSR